MLPQTHRALGLLQSYVKQAGNDSFVFLSRTEEKPTKPSHYF